VIVVLKPLNWLLVAAAAWLCGCTKDYSFQIFTYPKMADVDGDQWTHLLEVKVESEKSPITKRCSKMVRLIVADREKRNFLKYDIYFRNVASISAEVEWADLNHFKVLLLEEGNQYASDSINADLVRRGPQRLTEISCQWQNESEKFQCGIDPLSDTRIISPR